MMDLLDYLKKKVDAVSDLEWEKLTALEASCEDKWTHAVILDVPEIVDVETSPIAAFSPVPAGESYEETVPILYGSESACRAKAGITLTKGELWSLLNTWEAELLKNYEFPTP